MNIITVRIADVGADLVLSLSFKSNHSLIITMPWSLPSPLFNYKIYNFNQMINNGNPCAEPFTNNYLKKKQLL